MTVVLRRHHRAGRHLLFSTIGQTRARSRPI